MVITKETTEKEALAIGKNCDTCGRCCSYGSGLMLEREIPRIAAFLNIDTDKLVKVYLEQTEIFDTKVYKIRSVKKDDKPYGPCAFLKENRCSIHKVKPLHCKVCNCVEGDDMHAWFLVNYLFNPHDPESVRQYHSYIKTGGRVLKGAELNTLFPDKALLKRILNYERLK